MFTGIVEEVGTVDTIQIKEGGMEVGICAPVLFSGLRIGDSLAVNGTCLTVTKKNPPATLSFDVSSETLSRTGMGSLKPGDPVNLEPALTLNKPLGGHLVSGHVDGQAILSAIRPMGEMVEMTFEVPESLSDLMIEKGSVALDGISLTIASLDKTSLTVAVIPHTLEQTTLGRKKVGESLNVETDMIGKYVKKFLSHSDPSKREVLTPDFLAEHGFLD
jgi:riboflavin synthase